MVALAGVKCHGKKERPVTAPGIIIWVEHYFASCSHCRISWWNGEMERRASPW